MEEDEFTVLARHMAQELTRCACFCINLILEHGIDAGDLPVTKSVYRHIPYPDEHYGFLKFWDLMKSRSPKTEYIGLINVFVN